MTFAKELNRFGPDTLGDVPLALVEANAYCRGLATGHYENFPVVSWLLPRGLRQHFYNIYAYCRWADDLSDEVGDTAESLKLLSWWQGQLRACYDGRACHPVFVALKPTIDEFGIPVQPFEDLVSAFRQDQQVHEYQTFDELLGYCRGSANPVGRLVLYLCRAFDDRNAAWSDSICTGLQLANFWQDVARDLDMGRIYLSVEDCERFSYCRDDLRGRVTNDAFLDLMQFEVNRAEQFLRAGLPLIEVLPGRLQVDVELFAHGGLKILERIRRIDFRVWETRPVVTKADIARLFCGCLWRACWRRVAGLRRIRNNPG